MISGSLYRLGRLGRFVWSGWAGLAGVALLAAAWQAGHEAYGAFILPSPLGTLGAVVRLLGDGSTVALLLTTVQRALAGFVFCAVVGTCTGIAAGYSPATLRLLRPILTVLIGVPPIAWIVLAMIWFGSSDATVALTILVSSTPVVFVGAVEGVTSRDRGLDAMAQAFGAGSLRRFTHVAARQIAAHVLPAMTLALGGAFKVAVMAELLANIDGIGVALAMSRSNLDVAQSIAWVVIIVAVIFIVEYGVVQPVRAELERWREAGRPWGVRR